MLPLRTSLPVWCLLVPLLVLAGGGEISGAQATSSNVFDEVREAAGKEDKARMAKLVKPLAGTDLATAWCIWHESTNAWGTITTTISPDLQRMRARLVTNLYLLTTGAEGLARGGDLDGARAMLAQVAWDGVGTGPALGHATNGRIALVAGDLAEAKALYARGQAALRRAASNDGVA